MLLRVNTQTLQRRLERSIFRPHCQCKAGFTLRRLDRRLDKRPAPLVKVAKSL